MDGIILNGIINEGDKQNVAERRQGETVEKIDRKKKQIKTEQMTRESIQFGTHHCIFNWLINII